MIGTLYGQWSLYAGLYLSEWVTFFTQVSEEACNELIEREPVIEWLVSSRAHVNAAAFAKLDPAASRQLTIRGANSVGVYVVTSREVTRARQALTDFEVVADDAENDLRHELLADRDFAAFGDPESHVEFDRIPKFPWL